MKQGIRPVLAALATAAAISLLGSCGTLATPPTAKPQGEVKKSPNLTEGQLQEKYILRRNEGKRLLDAKKWGEALDAYLEANSIRQNMPDILLGIGDAYYGLEYWEKAAIFYDRYLKNEKDQNPAVYARLAVFFADKLENLGTAIALMSKAIEAREDPPRATDFLYRGRLMESAGRNVDAIADYKMAQDLAAKAKDDRTVQDATKALAAIVSVVK